MLLDGSLGYQQTGESWVPADKGSIRHEWTGKVDMSRRGKCVVP